MLLSPKCVRLLVVNFRFASNKAHKAVEKMKILNVAEKNDAAKNIAEILSGGRVNRREGASKFNKIYEFGFDFQGTHVSMVMTSVSGHLLNYDFPPPYKSWHSCDPLILFDAPISKNVIKDGEPIKETLRREVRACQKLIVWTDCDREGENIGVEIVNICQEVKPNIEVLRAKFSEITPRAIHRAISQLTVPDIRVSSAVDARQELDLRIGAAFTRFQTLRLQRVFPRALSQQLISYGSCQFPTLGFVVERFREVDRFVSEPFWRIVVTAERNGKSADFQWKRGRLFDRDCCKAYYDHLLENRYGQIVEVIKRPKSKWRPVALDTVELEKLATRKLRIGAKMAMQIAERLYNKGFISYPRTETNIFPKDLDFAGLVRAQTQDNRWAAFAARVLEQGPNPRNGKSTDKAHPPIHPLKAGSGLQGDEARIYELVARHFLACLSADAQGAETVVRLCIGKPSVVQSPNLLTPEDGEMFEAKGLVILASNYLDVYIYDRWTERDMPEFRLADWILPTNIEMLSGQTAPPPLLTEADLISLMDRHGIGTDATHAEHIETIKQRLYVGLEQAKFLVPGQLGMGLIEGYDSMGFEMSKPNLRAELEADLKLICEGRKTKEEVLQYHLAKYRSLFQQAVSKASQLDQALALRLEQTAEDLTGVSGSLGEMSSFGSGTSASQNATGFQSHSVASCPSCGRAIVLRQRRPPHQPLNELNQPVAFSVAGGSPESGLPTTWFLSCTGYPSCRYAIWFPDSVVAARVVGTMGNETPEVCLRCRQFAPPNDSNGVSSPLDGPLKLALQLRRSVRLPNGYVQDDPSKEYITCVFCDEDLRNALGLRIAAVQPREIQLSTTRPNSKSPLPANAVGRSSPPPRQNVLPALSPSLSGRQNGSRSFSTSSSIPATLSAVDHPFPSASDFRQSAPIRDPLSAPSSDQDVVVCNCGIQAVVLTVKKSGPNQGRLFYRCGGGPENSCNFFQWKTPPGGPVDGTSGPLMASTQFPQSSAVPSGYRPQHSEFDRIIGQASNSSPSLSNFVHPPAWSSSGVGSSVSGAAVLCRCGQQAKLLRVTRATANQGREFYTCPNSRPGADGAPGSGCNFFMWADSLSGPLTQSGTDTSGGSWQASRSWSSNEGTGTRWRGSSESSGVSVGHVPQWPPPASTGLRGNSRRESSGGKIRGGGSARRCGLCGETGHTRTRCPRRSDQD
ncbi:unnamed protein product [Calicophoron daubneyi]|uniref:DNA topoisomerase n=1 Tax=Calicophoron daubneyi TaxID=300641 RepID=A0AAV2T5U3_CALDB